MKLLYFSVHSILEYSEVKLFTEQKIDVFSWGAYSDPKGHYLLPRPGIEGMPFYPEYLRISRETPRTNIPKEFFDNFDVIIWMDGVGQREALIENWPKLRGRKVIWRTIGQSTPEAERMLKPLRDQDLKIVRYSPKESNMPDFIGADAMIRFHYDPEEFQGWNGQIKQVINTTQSLKARGGHCHYEEIIKVFSGFPAKVFGPGNDNLGNLNGGELPYELLKGQLRDNKCFFYAGTYPASYTLSFIEALMTGLPVVSIGKKLAQLPGAEAWDFFEIPDIIDHGQSGFVADSIDELRGYITQVLEDDELAKKLSENGRKKAISLFSKNVVKSDWTKLFNKL